MHHAHYESNCTLVVIPETKYLSLGFSKEINVNSRLLLLLFFTLGKYPYFLWTC